MKNTSHKILALFEGNPILEAFRGLTKVKLAKKEDPETCVYVRKAEAMFYRYEYELFINKLKEIINEYEQRT